MGFDPKEAYSLYGTYIALTYLTPFLGGFLADRKLGYINAVYIGGSLMGLGYLGFAMDGIEYFYISMALVIIGNGFFKPSISTLLGNLYSTDEYKANKDSGFNIFYMGINIGVFACNIIAAFMRNKYSWDAAFITASVGMFLGLLIFSLGMRHYKAANVRKSATKDDISIGKLFGIVFLPAIIAGVIGWFIPGNITGSDSNDAFIFACIPVVFYFVSLLVKANTEDKRPIAALISIFAVSIMFWAVFKQNGTVLTDWAENYTDRQVKGKVEQVATSLYLADTVSYTQREITAFDNNYKLIKENGVEQKIVDYPMYFDN